MIKKFDINMREISGYVDGESDKRIITELKKQELYFENFLYSVFNGQRAEQIEKTGVYRQGNPNEIFAFSKENLSWNGEGITGGLDLYTKNYELPAIAIYDRTHFSDKNCGVYEFSFKNPNKKVDAVRGIGFLRF